MMDYNLNNLGSDNFEHLVQALSKKLLGEGVSIYGAGPDGQREATFTGKANYPSDKEYWDGYWVIQAKFKSPNTKIADFPWLKKCFEDEMKGFEAKKKEGKQIPDNYLFFTNVVLTPVLEKGIKDKMEKLADSYKSLIPHIHILGSDEVKRFLDGHRDVAVCYASYICAGDILSLLYQQVNEQERQRQNTFFRYLTQAFNDDYFSKMEQAGQLTEDRASIDKVYVDLYFKYESRNEIGKFIENALVVGNKIFRFSESQKNISQSEESKVSNKYVLKGLAGQGKSTVCQFLAQIYRAAFLNNFNIHNSEKISEFIERIKADGLVLPTCFRIPFRVELRLFSSWMISRKKEGKSVDLITYISTIIGEKASDKFDNETLRLYFEKYSWIFFFDGLDEVPESSNRNDVMNEINRFIEVELRQVNADALFFATTRPEGYVGEFKKTEFEHIDLLPLNKETCFKYLEKLLYAIESDSTNRKNYMEILRQGFDNKQISFMMQTPLQATIITILVRAGGEPPRDKYSLFKEYFDIILKREKQKGVGSILNTNQDLIEGIYYLLGYDLQKKSSTAEASDALISTSRLKELIGEQLESDGITQSSPDYLIMLQKAYEIIVLRINFASEIKEGYIGFSIRSMQEFLAAVYIEKNTADQNLSEIVKKLAKSSYWKNTFIFLVECIAKNKKYYLDCLIDTVLGELNGSHLPVGEIDETSSIYYGSQIAMTLLTNNIFKNKPKYENKLCKYILQFSELQSSKEFPQISTLSDNVKNELTNFLLSKEHITNMDINLILVLLKGEKCSDSFLEFAKNHSDDIVAQLNTNNYSPSASLYEVINIAIERGQILKLNIEEIVDIIKNAQISDSFAAKQTLFKSIIRIIMQYPHRNRNESISFINDYFGCPMQILYDLFGLSKESSQITDYISVSPFVGENDTSKLEKIIKKAEEFSLGGLVLILKTVCSKNIKDYQKFYNEIYQYKTEVEELIEVGLISQNKIANILYQKVLGNDTAEIDKIICDDTQNYLNECAVPLDLVGLFKQCERDLLLPRVSVVIGNNFDLFKTTLCTLYTEEQIRTYPALCSLIVFVYLCTCESHENFPDENTSGFLGSSNEIISILECAKIAKRSNGWSQYLIFYAFLHLNLKELVENMPSYIKCIKHYAQFTPFEFSSTEVETIINNLINYIDFTDDIAALDYLYELVLYKSNLTLLINTSWEKLAKFRDKKIALIAEISKVTKENIIDNVLLMLEDDETCEFAFQLMKTLSFPECFMPIYFYFLKKYRVSCDVEKLIVLENAIYEQITSKNAEM